MKKYLSLVKFSHTVFALPFALLGYFIGIHTADNSFSWRTLLLVVLCMVFSRNAAMAFNRWADQDIDRQNPRTAIREIPAGILSANKVLLFVVVNCVLFIVATYFINPLCFYLSPIALLVVLGYSLTKRFTALCHIVLGLGLSLAPIGAYLAVTGVFNIVPILFSASILFWVSGFDIIYALQDVDFDKKHGLNSIPSALGKNRALLVSKVLHLICGVLLLIGTYYIGSYFPETSWLKWGGAAVFIGMLIYQHTLVRPDDLSRVNLAFFTTNGIASVIFGVCAILGFYF